MSLDQLNVYLTFEYISLAVALLIALILYIAFKFDKGGREQGLFYSLQDSAIGFFGAIGKELNDFGNYLFGQKRREIIASFDEGRFDSAIQTCVKLGFFIAVVSFAGTYKATYEFALDRGFGLASYGMPIALDLFTILLGYVIYTFSLSGEKKPFAVSLGLFTTASLSTWFNIQHAQDASESFTRSITLLGAIFPLALACSIELISLLNRLRLQRSALVKSSEDIANEIAMKKTEFAQLQNEIAQASERLSTIIAASQKRELQDSASDSEVSTRDKVKDLHLAGKKPTEIADILDVSTSLVYQYRREIENEIAQTNGVSR